MFTAALCYLRFTEGGRDPFDRKNKTMPQWCLYRDPEREAAIWSWGTGTGELIDPLDNYWRFLQDNRLVLTGPLQGPCCQDCWRHTGEWRESGILLHPSSFIPGICNLV